jgi:hypothetical protein
MNNSGKIIWLISCDESGVHGAPYYGFGTLWMKWQRRGDIFDDIREMKARHSFGGEVKWKKAHNKRQLKFHKELVEYFFKKEWMTFHCFVVHKAIVKKELHENSWDLARRKHFVALLSNKMDRVCRKYRGRDIGFRVYVDKIHSSYEKADEAVEVITNHILNRLGNRYPIDSVITRDSKETPTIQLCDLLLGAVMDAWQKEAESETKIELEKFIAEHLGWPDLQSDTFPRERKFNIWYFHDVERPRRDVSTRKVNLKYPLKS